MHFIAIWHQFREHQGIIAAWFTVVVLVLALAWSMFVEIPKFQKKVKFLRLNVFKPHSGSSQVFTRVDVDFSNNCRRIIHPRELYVTAKGGKRSDMVYDNTDLEEGDDQRLVTDFIGVFLEVNDIRKVMLLDSTNHIYRGYVYEGKFVSRRAYYFFRFLDWISFI